MATGATRVLIVLAVLLLPAGCIVGPQDDLPGAGPNAAADNGRGDYTDGDADQDEAVPGEDGGKDDEGWGAEYFPDDGTAGAFAGGSDDPDDSTPNGLDIDDLVRPQGPLGPPDSLPVPRPRFPALDLDANPPAEPSTAEDGDDDDRGGGAERPQD